MDPPILWARRSEDPPFLDRIPLRSPEDPLRIPEAMPALSVRSGRLREGTQVHNFDFSTCSTLFLDLQEKAFGKRLLNDGWP